MKKTYLFPQAKVKALYWEQNFLTSSKKDGTATGEDLDDPVDFDPWN